VEDSPLLARRIGESIAHLSNVQLVGVADTEHDALHLLNETAPHVLILDLQLRLGSGFGVLRGMKDMRPVPRVIVLTTYGMFEYQRVAQSLGATVFLDKSRDYHLLPELLAQYAQALA
jgi:two-component system response regulator YesN